MSTSAVHHRPRPSSSSTANSAAAAVVPSNEAEPLDSNTQNQIIRQLCQDIQQQAHTWQVILWVIGLLLSAVCLSLFFAADLTVFHTSFTRSLSAAAHPRLYVLLILHYILLITATVSLISLIQTGDPLLLVHSPSVTHSTRSHFAALFALIATILIISSMCWSGPARSIGFIYLLLMLYWLLTVYACWTQQRLREEIRHLNKLRYAYHTA